MRHSFIFFVVMVLVLDAFSANAQESACGTSHLLLVSDVNRIYADNGLTIANLLAVLKDADNQILPNREIIFTSTHGVVSSPAITDSLGIARSVFIDTGMPSKNADGDIVPAVITAKYNPMSLTSMVEISILERNPVDRITLRAFWGPMTVGYPDSTIVRATCFLSNDDYAPRGQFVFFEANPGRFLYEVVIVSGSFGQAENWYFPKSNTGTTYLRAYVINDDSSMIFSNEVEINLGSTKQK
ncbi:MAG: Ig-like domain-containing protein [Candidatus Hatepunaea meridiana]|nr:Ig-like domain-containing protein [Candidatus Hatepunaea meridiana]